MLVSFTATASWDITPIRLSLDARNTTGAVTLRNEGPQPLSFQIWLAEWTQVTEGGEDQYEPSRDLVWFPQMLTVEPGEKRLIRVGARQPPPQTERSYRLFVEEMPALDPEERQGAQLAVRIRFGVPIFQLPVEPVKAAELLEASVEGAVVTVKLRNLGNQHLRFDTLEAREGDTLIGEASGWYLLPGVERAFRIELDAKACAAAGAVEILLSANDYALRETLDVKPEYCKR